jgi:hypothetical protein
MSNAKQKFVHMNAHNVVGRHFNAGVKFASKYVTPATAVCRCIGTVAAVVAVPFGTAIIM